EVRNADEPEKRMAVQVRQGAERWLRNVEPLLPAIAALQQLAETTFGGATLSRTWHDLQAFCERWLRLPPGPANLLALLQQALQPILDDPVSHAVTGAAALRFLSDVLRRQRSPVGRYGEPRVFVGSASQAAGLPFAAVRVLGLAEGASPHTPHDDPIVPDAL